MSTQALEQISVRNDHSFFVGVKSATGEIRGLLSELGVDGLPVQVYEGTVQIHDNDIVKHGHGSLLYNGTPYLTGLFESDMPKEKFEFIMTDGTKIVGPIVGINRDFFVDRIEAYEIVSTDSTGKYDNIIEMFIGLDEPYTFYVPHGLCTEFKDGNMIYEGMYSSGYRHGMGELYLNKTSYVDGKFNYGNLMYAKLFVNDEIVFEGIPTFETTIKFGSYDMTGFKKNKATKAHDDESNAKKTKKSKV